MFIYVPLYFPVTYNVLAETYAIGYSRYKYQNVSDEVISWNYRFNLIKEHITKSEADIVCLQEVELKSFNGEFTPFFKAMGFSGIMQEDKSIGNALFYNDNKFKLYCTNSRSRVLIAALIPLTQQEAQLLQQQQQQQQIKQQEEKQVVMAASVMPVVEAPVAQQEEQKQQVDQQQAQQQKKQKSNKSPRKQQAPAPTPPQLPQLANAPLYICNAHLDGNPLKPHERFNQMKSLFAQLKKEELTGTFSIKEAIICGDFNCDHKSGIYELVTSGKLTKEFRNPITPDLAYTKEDFSIETHAGVSLDFSSAYAKVSSDGGEPDFTFAAPNHRRDPLDFIFYTHKSLKPVAVSDPMLLLNNSKQQVESEGIPNDWIPSDHLLLAAVFELVISQQDAIQQEQVKQ